MELKADPVGVMNVQPEDNIWRLHNQHQAGRQPRSGWFNTENVSQWAAAVQHRSSALCSVMTSRGRTGGGWEAREGGDVCRLLAD